MPIRINQNKTINISYDIYLLFLQKNKHTAFHHWFAINSYILLIFMYR